ncbi:helix-turn-helix transcriptional regulator [Celeribacter halophilus]|uniref:helix-turn-helix transcriptional regulator n=1 Tax=Celeribacter halophilus TaxID=576117 RepID=UPI003A92A4EC
MRRREDNMQKKYETDHLDRLIDEKEAASYLCYSVRALQNWRVRGGGPLFIKVSGRSVRYTRRDLQDWIGAKRVANTTCAPS